MTNPAKYSALAAAIVAPNLLPKGSIHNHPEFLKQAYDIGKEIAAREIKAR